MNVSDIITLQNLFDFLMGIIEENKSKVEIPVILSVFTNILAGFKHNEVTHKKSGVKYFISGFAIRTTEPKGINVNYFKEGEEISFEMKPMQPIVTKSQLLFTRDFIEFQNSFEMSKETSLYFIALADIYDKHFIQKKYFLRTDEYGKNKPLEQANETTYKPPRDWFEADQTDEEF